MGSLKSRIRRLMKKEARPQLVHVIQAWSDEEFDIERARRKAAGEIASHDLVVHIHNF